MRLEDAIETAEQADVSRRAPAELELDGDRGTITTPAFAGDTVPDEVTIFAHWNLDPNEWRIVPPLRVNAWEMPSGSAKPVIMRQYKADVVRRLSHRADTAAEVADIMKVRPPKPLDPSKVSDRVWCAVFSDPQLGKGLEGAGTAEIVDRWIGSLGRAVYEAKQARRRGVRSGVLILPGDTIEGCSGFYPMQTFTVDLPLRDQLNAARRLVVRTVRDLAPLFDEFHVLAVGGNHGEVRNSGGKAFTTPDDNLDLQVVDAARDVLAENPDRFGHVNWVLPRKSRPWVVADINRVRVAVHHGNVHGGGKPAQKIREWWKGQSHGVGAVGDADVLFTGHWHHHFVDQSFGRTLIGAPSLDNGSAWWENSTGQMSPPGALVVELDSSRVGAVVSVRAI